MVHGELEIGNGSQAPHAQCDLTLTDNVKGEDISGVGGTTDAWTAGIMLMGGTLNLHGDRTNFLDEAVQHSERRRHLDPGPERCRLARRRRDRSRITDFDPRQAERRNIAAISGNTITLDKKLDYMHFGKITFDVDERGEVGLLTRNIKLQASADAEQSFYGGHVMAMVGSKMLSKASSSNRMGQNLTLPGIRSTASDRRCTGAVHQELGAPRHYNRCVTVHGTNFLHVENNVTYNTVGHCFFLEDGIEHGNEFIKNLAIQTNVIRHWNACPRISPPTERETPSMRIVRPTGK